MTPFGLFADLLWGRAVLLFRGAGALFVRRGQIQRNLSLAGTLTRSPGCLATNEPEGISGGVWRTFSGEKMRNAPQIGFPCFSPCSGRGAIYLLLDFTRWGSTYFIWFKKLVQCLVKILIKLSVIVVLRVWDLCLSILHHKTTLFSFKPILNVL